MPESSPPKSVANLLSEFAETMQAIGETLKVHVEGWAHRRQVASRLDEVGWLPHHTTPISVVLESHQDSLDALLSEYYVAEWELIREAIFARSRSYDIDSETKATVDEALTAHGHGLYRSSCRVLFPEIERVSRIEVHGQVWMKKPITSQKDLIELMNQLPAGVSLTDLWAFDLIGKLSSHIYEQADASNMERFQSIPNRHAAVHGLIPYTSLKNSMNTIIIADYVFAFISAAKAYARSRGQFSE